MTASWKIHRQERNTSWTLLINLQKQYEEEEPILNSLCQNIKEMLTSKCQEVVEEEATERLDHSRNLAQDSATEGEKIKKNNSRTRATKAQEDHTKANIEVRKSVKMDKRNYINGLAKEAEQAADSGNIRQMYDTTRKV